MIRHIIETNLKSAIMKRSTLSLSLLTVCILFTGCVSKKQFAGLQTDYNKLQTENSDLRKSYQDTQVQLVESRTNKKSGRPFGRSQKE